ncbi:hypothetical protein ACGFJT_37465 [Actinomadura geliboluensis]|uniref:hypothetical protein n=1 Tax=Actinomadura geliboluensis TaxID=882440 RepID=UPI0037216014
MNTWTIRYTDGETVTLAPMPETEAHILLNDVRSHVDPNAALVDLVAEIAARMPVGSRVRHITTRRAGTVVLSNATAAPFPRLPAVPDGAQAAYVLTSRYTAICVKFDHRDHAEWFDATFIAPEHDTDDEPAQADAATPAARLQERTRTNTHQQAHAILTRPIRKEDRR